MQLVTLVGYNMLSCLMLFNVPQNYVLHVSMSKLDIVSSLLDADQIEYTVNMLYVVKR